MVRDFLKITFIHLVEMILDFLKAIGPTLAKLEEVENFDSIWWVSPLPEFFVTYCQHINHQHVQP